MKNYLTFKVMLTGLLVVFDLGGGSGSGSEGNSYCDG